MFFILSKDQHNKLSAIANWRELRSAHEALDWALEEAAGPLMEDFQAQRETWNEKRRDKFAKRKKSVKTKNYRRG